MKNIIIALACFLLILIVATSHSYRDIGSIPGKIAPTFTLSDDSDSVELAKLRGKHVVLSFWTSADAESRISNIKYNNLISDLHDKPIEMVGINYDRNERLFRDLAHHDKLDAGVQLFDKAGKKSEIYGMYGLKHGYKSVLIDPSGRIIEVNPGTERLKEILASIEQS